MDKFGDGWMDGRTAERVRDGVEDEAGGWGVGRVNKWNGGCVCRW